MKKLLLLIGVCLSALAYGQIPTINLSSEVKFNNGSIDNTASSLNFSQTGSAMSTIPNRAGGLDRAVALQGDYLHRANDATNSISVSYWVQTTTNDANKRVIIDQTERSSDTEASNHTGWYTYLENGKIGITGNFQWYHSSNTAAGNTGYMGYQHLLSNATLNDGTWHHVGITMRARWYNWFNAPYGRTDRVVECQYILYIDGVQDGVLTQRQNLGNAPSPAMRRFTNSSNMRITIGNNRVGNSTVPYQNGFDDFRYYRLILSGTQMTQLYNETACAGSTSVTALTQDITIQLDVNGNALISAADVDNGSENSCGEPANISVSKTLFNCNDLGTNTVTLTSDDGEGNTNTATAVVTVEPLITVTPQFFNVILELDETGNATLDPNDVDMGSTASCAGGLTFSLDKTAFTCNDTGTRSVILTATHPSGASASASATVSVRDVTLPDVVTQDITVTLDASGQAIITPAQIDNGSTDACGTFTLSLSKTVFTCDDLGDNQVILTAISSSSVSRTASTPTTSAGTATATVTVLSGLADLAVTTPSTTFCPDGSPSASTTVNVAGSETGVDYYLRNSANNAVVDGPIAGNGGNLTLNTGTLSETSTFNVFAKPQPTSSTGTALAFDGVNDKVQTTYSLPTTSNLTIEAMFYPSSGKFARIISNYRGSNGLAPGEFDIDNADLGGGVGRGLRFILADANGTAHLYGVPNALTLNAWNHIAVTFNSGTIKLFVNGIQVGSSTAPFTTIPANNKGIALGEDRIQGFGEYYHGKMDEVRFWTTVRTPTELIANKDKCLVGDEAGLDAYYNFEDATGNILTDLVGGKNGTLTNMDPNSDWVSGTTLTCASGCGAQMMTEVTIGDDVAPTAVAQGITAQLDGQGNATITATQVNNGSTDNCTDINSLLLSLDKTSFTCADIGANTVTLTVEDADGNQATATSTVTVQDGIAPMAIAKNISIPLDASGNATFTAVDINDNSSDNCTNINLSHMSIDMNSVDCTSGPTTVTLTVEDAAGNQSTATAIVTPVDGVLPTAVGKDITAQLDVDGNASIVAADIDNGSTDNCVAGLTFSVDKDTFTCADLGDNDVRFTATDATGNANTMIVTVTVEDNVAPTVIARDITVNLDNDGNATITAAQVNNGSTDNCTEPTNLVLSIDNSTFTTADLGANTVQLTVEDASGNTSTATATVTIEEKTVQTITFGALADLTYGDSDITLTSTSDSNLPVSFAVMSGPATLSGNTLTVTGAGTVVIEASQAGDATFGVATPVQQTFEVNKAALIVQATDLSITYGDAIPTLAPSYSGFVNGDTDASLDEVPVMTTTATATSDAGTYPLTLAGGADVNYVLTIENGTLTINKADQTITIKTVPNKVISDVPFDLLATTTSGLALSYMVTSGPATVSGATVTLTGTDGIVTIEVSEAGNINYIAASAVVTFTVTDPSKADQIITIDVISDKFTTDSPFDVVASTTSNLALNYVIESGPATISGTTITLDGTEGTVVMEVTQAGNDSFNSASASASFNVTEFVDPCVDFSVLLVGTTDVIAGNDGTADVTVSGGTEPYTFSWSNGATSEDLSGVSGGNYTVTVTDANGCSQTLTVTVGDIVLATEHDLNTSFKYYPNPAKEYLMIEASFDKISTVEIQLLDVAGRVMIVKSIANVDQVSTRIETRGLKSGIYLLVVKTNLTQKVERITITQ